MQWESYFFTTLDCTFSVQRTHNPDSEMQNLQLDERINAAAFCNKNYQVLIFISIMYCLFYISFYMGLVVCVKYMYVMYVCDNVNTNINTYTRLSDCLHGLQDCSMVIF